jgi:hypothetical protein
MPTPNDDSARSDAQLRIELSLARRQLHAHAAAMRVYLRRGEADLAGEEQLAAERARDKIGELTALLRRRR